MEPQNKPQTKEFKKIFNPHTKITAKANGKKDAMRNQNNLPINNVPDSNQKQDFVQPTRENVKIDKLADKNSFSRELLAEGYIDSFIDFFYLANQKTPDIISKYKRENNFYVDPNDSGTRHIEHSMNNLLLCKSYFKTAESYLRNGQVEKAIDIYMEDVRKVLFYNKDDEKTKQSNSNGDTPQDILGSVYIIQKSINLSKRYQLLNKLINALNKMGICFGFNSKSSEDNILSMGFMEEAKNLYKKMDISFQDINLEKGIYHALADLYNSLAFNEEKQNNIEKCNEYLHKKLENLENEHNIIKRIKESSGARGDKEINKIENANITDQLEVYLKIAENNFKLKNYQATIKCLDGVIERCNASVDPSNLLKIKAEFNYAKTYEAQNDIAEAIIHLKEIDRTENQSHSTDDEIYAKSLLNLGRLNFHQKNLEDSYKYLNKFFKKAKNVTDKKLLDIARVNLGMIRGSQGMNEYIKLINNSSYSEFLKMKLKYFVDS